MLTAAAAAIVVVCIVLGVVVALCARKRPDQALPLPHVQVLHVPMQQPQQRQRQQEQQSVRHQQTMPQVPIEARLKPFLYPAITRQQAEALLRDQPGGSFLLRVRDNANNSSMTFIVSVKERSGGVVHSLLNFDTHTRLFVSSTGATYPSMVRFLEHVGLIEPSRKADSRHSKMASRHYESTADGLMPQEAWSHRHYDVVNDFEEPDLRASAIYDTVPEELPSDDVITAAREAWIQSHYEMLGPEE